MAKRHDAPAYRLVFMWCKQDTEAFNCRLCRKHPRQVRSWPENRTPFIHAPEV